MSRARRAGPVALPFALILILVATSLATAARRPAFGAAPRRRESRVAAAVAWPTSTLVISEVQTGGASASDEFAELANAGPLAGRPDGLELVYATSTGSTVTRKATWTTSTILEPGRHLLIANAAGIYAGDRRRDVLGRLRGDRRRARAARRRRHADRRGRLGRRDERVRRGDGRAGAGGRLEHRAAARRSRRQRDRHERQRGRLRRRDAESAEPGGRRRLRARARSPTPDADADADARRQRRRRPRRRLRRRPDADADADPDADAHANADADADRADPDPDADAQPDARRRRPRRRPTPTPTPTPDPAPSPRSPTRGLAGRFDGHGRRHPDNEPRRDRLGRIGFIQDATGGIALRLDAALPTPIPAGTS